MPNLNRIMNLPEGASFSLRMECSRKIKDNRALFIFLGVYLVIRVFLLNINYTEWGDTFRMIRAADYLSKASWPWDEKRWPLYSVFLIPGVWLNIPVFWGRVIAILISSASLGMIYAFYLKYISKNKLYALYAAMFVATSSVFGYWSFRVMADPLFALLVLVYFYFFPQIYTEKRNENSEFLLSGLLLMITMTRLEGLFVASATGVFFLIYSISKKKFGFKIKNLKDNLTSILIFFIPQVLIYLPWTLYAKVLYKGPVSNNYLDEVETFVFNLERFKYFFTYSAFVLVIPITVYFAWQGFKAIKSRKNLYLIPLALFILQEFLIGFIWTPSLPRIYMPVIPFLGMLFILGVEVFNNKKLDVKRYMVINLVITFLFAYFQYSQRLYFLGASKLLFGFILFMNLVLIILPLLKIDYKKYLITLSLILNLVIVSVIIYNQSYVYKSVMKGIEFVAPLEGPIAYSDETGNSDWYLRSKGYYLDPENAIENLDEQYELLKYNNIPYMLWTDEFNRKSAFIDPKADPRFAIVYIYQQPIRDPLDIVADKLNILDDSDYTVFTTKVYKVL